MEIDEGEGSSFPQKRQTAKKTDLEPREILNAEIPFHIKEEVDKAVDGAINLMRHDVECKIKNLHIDLIRQFCQQENEVESHLQTIAIHNRKQKTIIQ